MNDFEILYRPPFEHNSFLLPVTAGCSHNACSFCTMYSEIPFRVLPLEKVERYLLAARGYYPGATRVFLENGDPFVLSAERLEAICGLIHRHLPQVRTIAMYAGIGNIRTKTDEELAQLRRLGVNDLNIGVESGLDCALAFLNKGYTASEARTQLLRLKEAGMDFGANVIFGSAGSGHGEEHALATAELLNETQPNLIFTGTLHADPGCPLYDALERGEFRENTLEEYFQEEETFVRALRMESALYFGLHPSNVSGLYGRLPESRDAMLRQLRARKAERTPKELARTPERGPEGAVL